MRKILSHPNKDLHIHLNGVLQKINRRGFTNIISNFVSPNHDIAKINENFQNMFNGIFSGYRDHSYLSAYISLYIIFKNKQLKDKILNENILFINIISNIIASHHGYIKNITEIFDDEQLEKLKNFLESDTKLPFEDFIKEHYKDIIYDDFIFDRRYNKKIIDYASNKKYVSLWGENAIKYYYDTIFNFAQLIEADKRDASDNENYEILENIKNYNYTFDNNLNLYLSKLKSNSELNLKRLEIRNDAEKNLLNNLKTNNRMFELTAPTGSGKTFMMLKLANIIQQEKGDYGIIMSLPFTSIIDQTADICETDILLNCLNYTSVSNTTHELNKLINELDNNYNSINLKNLISCNFPEETFDHPFVITTFIQFFQTLISNKNNVAIKLPNFTKRIFLIDEFQSLPSSLYTFFYGILQYFCETYDCYCVLSTATMPNFNLNNKRII